MGKVKRFKDFDAMLSEKRQETVTIRVYGENYAIPAVVPAYIVLFSAKLAEEGEGYVDFLREAGDALFGRENMRKWTSQGMLLHQLESLIIGTISLINGEEEEEPEAVTEGDEGKQSPKK